MIHYQHQRQEDFNDELFLADDFRKREFIKELSLRPDCAGNETISGNKEAVVTLFDYDELDEYLGTPMMLWLVKTNEVCEKVSKMADIGTVYISNGVVKALGDIFYYLTCYEEKLTLVTSMCLICYGGSWRGLASILAAAEVFETKKVLENAGEITQKVIFEDEEDITPNQIIETLKKVGLQVALFSAVLFCETWAAICVVFAVTYRLSISVRLEKALARLRKFLGTRQVLDEIFYMTDVALITISFYLSCVVATVILVSSFPGLISAVYMAYLGIQWGRRHISFEVPEVMTWNQHCCVWGASVLAALWQGYNGYSGAYLFLSWLMFLQPFARFLNMTNNYFIAAISSLKIYL